MDLLEKPAPSEPKRLRKSERRDQILLELRLRPHVRISEMANRFGVSTETVRRDMDKLSRDGLISRAHGGASAAGQGHYPGLDERSAARQAERERIGQMAAGLVQPGETLMVDAGSTTLQMARFLAQAHVKCTVITNSLPIAMTLGHNGDIEVVLCPGDYLPSESAVIGTDTIEFLGKHNVNRCMIGASGLSEDGPTETVRGFAAVKRGMIAASAHTHLLIDSEKFGNSGLSVVSDLRGLASVIVDRAPEGALKKAIERAGTDLMVAPE